MFPSNATRSHRFPEGQHSDRLTGSSYFNLNCGWRHFTTFVCWNSVDTATNPLLDWQFAESYKGYWTHPYKFTCTCYLTRWLIPSDEGWEARYIRCIFSPSFQMFDSSPNQKGPIIICCTTILRNEGHWRQRWRSPISTGTFVSMGIYYFSLAEYFFNSDSHTLNQVMDRIHVLLDCENWIRPKAHTIADHTSFTLSNMSQPPMWYALVRVISVKTAPSPKRTNFPENFLHLCFGTLNAIL